ncbi:hypothetical protein C8Q74DRAFT_1241345 [Fomes fomentarius]|nr:hypothetical protein C8Q74DRAFT_1241345 [Fomes fomentarius]
MDGSKSGEAGVIAWCNSIRFTMAQDPGRQFLHEQIQKEGFDFLDMYLESFLEGPKREPVIELLKTPGRKKNAPARTRAATAASAKSKAITFTYFEDGDTKENHKPINDFHKTLLQAKEKDTFVDDERKAAPLRQPSGDRPRPQVPGSFAQLKNQRIVTIADSPAVNPLESMELGVAHDPLPAPNFDPPPAVIPSSSHEDALLVVKDSVKELSMIAEDDELVERSRMSLGYVSRSAHEPIEAQIESSKSNETVFHDAESQDVDMEENIVHHVEDVRTQESEELTYGDVTTMSSTTFHTIPLSPHEDPESTSARSAEFHTAPLPKVSLSPVPVEEEAESHTGHLPSASSSSLHEEYTAPLRDEPSALVPGLSRKPSLSQFAGLPAPSPLRKSLRTPGEPTSNIVIGTSATAHAVKRSSTSWLSKARETKALGNTVKRTSTLGVATSTFSANKRKSSEMLEAAKDHANAVLKALEEEERSTKLPKLSSPQAVFSNDQSKLQSVNFDSSRDVPVERPVFTAITTAPVTSVPRQDGEGDVLTTIFKKNYSAHTGKSTNKSLGGNAAAALAEARAQAEARVAERLKQELGMATDSEDVEMVSDEQSAPIQSPAQPASSQSTEFMESERRLSVSDLVPSSQASVMEKELEKASALAADTSTTTTPPNTPPRARTTSVTGPPAPVFSLPPAPAAPASSRDVTVPVRDFKLPTTNPFSIPAAMALGMGPKFAPLSAQSSKASVFSDIVFDRQDASPAWMTSTQDTSYSAQLQSQGSQPKGGNDDDLDEGDSWGVDEKFAGHQIWTPFGFTSSNPDQLKDDTWSTIPSRSTSQKGGDTGVMQITQSLFSSLPQSEKVEEEEEAEPERGFAQRLADAAQQPEDVDEVVDDEADMAMEIDDDDMRQDECEETDIEDAIPASKPTIKLVQHTKTDSSQPTRSDSQQSMASTSSSQSNLGFFGTASKLVSSVLGGGKKPKPEVKSLQRAAAAAKKQQEEQEKKAQRLKEMEARRQQALQRKAEEEKTRAAEEERKIKEDTERRKREREEHTDKRPLSRAANATKKGDDDTMKRKLGAPASQKPPSKDKKDTANPRQVKPSMGTTKPPLKSALKQPTAGPSGSTNPVTPGAGKGAKTVKHAPSTNNLKAAAAPPTTGKGKERDVQDSQYPQPTRKAPAPPPQEPRVASESIELPDINSEYSDSEDEDRPKRDLPDWAKSPDIAQALQQQSTINPDDIFGPIGPLRMEEIFRTRHSRFRARTSSANWTGPDELTQAEEREYAKRMGFK